LFTAKAVAGSQSLPLYKHLALWPLGRAVQEGCLLASPGKGEPGMMVIIINVYIKLMINHSNDCVPGIVLNAYKKYVAGSF
jgi:hypothetical protein